MKKKTPKKDSVGSVTFNKTKKVRGKTYGVSAVNASLGGTDLGPDLVAVLAGREKRVTTREHAVAWLSERGLDKPGEAKQFIEEGLKADVIGECPSCGKKRPGALAKGGNLFTPGSVCPECKHVEPENDGPPPGWKPTAESPTFEDLRSLAVRVLELLGDEKGAADKLNGRQFYALACLASLNEGNDDKVFGADRVGPETLKVI